MPSVPKSVVPSGLSPCIPPASSLKPKPKEGVDVWMSASCPALLKVASRLDFASAFPPDEGLNATAPANPLPLTSGLIGGAAVTEAMHAGLVGFVWQVESVLASTPFGSSGLGGFTGS